MSNLKDKGYHKLKVVAEAQKLIIMVYQVTEKFPRSELFGLTSQLRRCAVSILLNIVEGDRRKSSKDFYRFLGISDGSSAELEVGLEISLDLKFLSQLDYDLVESQRQLVSAMVVGLMKSVKRRLGVS